MRDGQTQLTLPGSDLWTTVYSAFLVSLILGYYALMLFFAGELLRWCIFFIRQTPSAGSLVTMAGYVSAAALAALLLVRAVRHVFHASLGLVTPKHDSVPEAKEGVEITRQGQPELFALIDRIGKVVRSPSPHEVRIHHGPEPGAFELRSFGIRPRRRLVLLLSLPQLGVFSEAEIGVVLAHELSHFGCGYTRLVVFLERFLNSLRMSVDRIRSQWWCWLDPIGWFQYGYLRFLVLLSAPIQRHQELRADGVSAALFGGEFAARTLLKNWLLGNQFLSSMSSFQPGKNGDAGENAFAWFRLRWRDFSAEGEDYLLSRLETMQTPSFWNDDPTIAERVRNMRSYPARDVAKTQPAREIVADYDSFEQRLQDLLLLVQS